jgi:hypothetical protein
MTLRYVTTDGAKWGSGLGRRLTAAEFDEDIWTLDERIVTLEGATAVGITGFGVTGTMFTVEMSDGSTFGPYELPQAQLTARDEWAPSVSYSVNDTFFINSSAYIVQYAHVSATAFNESANDGSGNYYYSKLLDAPDGKIPTGGATGYRLAKSSSNDFELYWAPPLPVSGATGYLLAKTSSTDFDADWIAPPTPIPPSGASGYVLAKASATSYDYEWIDPNAILPPSGATGYALVKASSNSYDYEWSDISGGITIPTAYTGPTGTGSVVLQAGDKHLIMLTPTGDITLSATGTVSGNFTLLITTTGTTAWNITAGSFFLLDGTFSTGTVGGAVFTISFVGDGAQAYEISRTGALG